MMLKKMRWFGYLALFAVLLTACSQSNNDSMSMLKQAQIDFDKGRLKEARELAQKALALDAQNPEAAFLVGRIAMQHKDIKTAARAFGQTLTLEPDHCEARLALATLLISNGQYDQARIQIEQVLKAAPGDYEALVLKSRLLMAQKSPDQAESILVTLLKENQDDRSELFSLLASARALKKDYTGAEQALEEGIAKYPRNGSLHLQLARLYRDTKKTEAAAGQLRKIMALEPANVIYPLTLAALYWDQQDEARAEAVLAQMVSEDAADVDRRLRVANFYLAHRQGPKAEQALKAAIEAIPGQTKLYLALSRLYQLAGHAAKAAETLQAHLDDDPKLSGDERQQVHLALAQACFQKRDMEAAILNNEKVLTENPDLVDAIWLKGRIEAARGRFDQAVSAFKAVVAKRPDFVEGYSQLSQVYMASGNPRSAAAILQQGVAVLPASKPLHLALARAFMACKDYKGAEAELLKTLKIDPSDDGVQAELGDFYADLKDVRRAQREYAEIVSKFPEKAIGYIKMANLHERQGDIASAINALAKGYARMPQSIQLLSEMVRIHMAADQPDAAIELCKQRLALDENDAVAHHLLGQVHIQRKQYKAAETELSKAVQAAPRWIEPGNQLAALVLKQGRTAEAVRLLESGLARNPRNPAAYLTLARLSEEADDVDKAVAYYEQGIANIADFTDAHQRLAMLLSQQEGDGKALEKALGLALRAYQLSPGRADIADTLGWIFHRRGDDDRARRILEIVADQVPQSPLVNYHMAMVLLKAGETDGARRRLEASLSSKAPFMGRDAAEQALQGLKKAG